MKHFLSILFIFIFTLSYAAQPGSDSLPIPYQSIFPLNRDMQLIYEREAVLLRWDELINFSSENKPYYIEYDDYVYNMLFDKKRKSSKSLGSILYNKIFIENLIRVKTEDVNLTIDPIFNFGYGTFNRDKNSINNYNSTYINTRGFIIRGAIGKKRTVTFFSTLYENQGRFIDYVDDFVSRNSVLPGEGVVKSFKNNAYDYSSATGIVCWTPSKHFNFQFGNGKNFIGDGYRSLLLSDNSFNYPFLKTRFNFGKIEYTNIYASFMIPVHHGEEIYTRKYSTMHLLSWNAGRNFNFSLFESTIWKATDGSQNLPFKGKYLNPFIGIQTLATGLNEVDNTMTGLNLRYNFFKHHSVYFQFVVDDLSAKNNGNYNDKLGLQAGYKYFDVFNIKNLYFQTEYNVVKPYTYAHKDSVQSYSHYNQPLAHPLGANFRESVTFLNYRWKDIMCEIKFNYAVYGADQSNHNFGQNILLSQNPEKYEIDMIQSKVAQGIKNTLIYKSFRIYYLINPVTNLNAYIEFQDRKLTSDITDYHSTYFNFGIKTNLDNFYYDF